MTGAGEPGCLHLPGKSPSLTVCLLCRSLSAQSCYLSLSEVDTLFCIAVLLLVFHTLLETNRHFTLKVVSSVEWEWRNWLQFFIPEYRLCHQSSACLNPWAVSWVCLVFVFCSAFALWLFSCTCFVRQYFPAHDSLDNIFLHMIHWTIFSCTWFIGQYFPAHAVLDNIFSYMRFRNVIILSAEWCYNRFSIRIGPRVHAVELYIDISMNGMCYGATVACSYSD